MMSRRDFRTSLASRLGEDREQRRADEYRFIGYYFRTLGARRRGEEKVATAADYRFSDAVSGHTWRGGEGGKRRRADEY